MLGFVREKVSKNKIRFRDEQEKFDLDLTCILAWHAQTAAKIFHAQTHSLTIFQASANPFSNFNTLYKYYTPRCVSFIA